MANKSVVKKRRRRQVGDKADGTAAQRKRPLEATEPEILDDLLNAPILRPQVPSEVLGVSRPLKRRRLRAPLRVPDVWQTSAKELFRIRPAPEHCKDTFGAKQNQVEPATGSMSSGLVFGSAPASVSSSSGGSIFTASPASSSGSIFASSGASSNASTGSIFGATAGSGTSSGSIFGATGSSFGATSGTSGGGNAFGASGSIFGAGGSAFGAAPPAGQPSMFAQAFQQSRPGPGGARRRRR
ncbi:Nuclear pore complex protein Nup96 (Nuclear pore complex protein Nup98) (Nuclear pore complex protein Nup98-Nup96) (Nucleoporin Nup96) (Nucleoporin Nup98) [Durusdinium trenchii]|uniref:Nuclear pore complex protein Nup96 (Nuclear pore complex protein Nup98) (Nuclear pore complex protein Nup98-Nup96) (Nucleoporin Nup96) (Nucleoporin Nup98) n=1 Tax=Durusdinium trenchii TaxID=1381693 RepID=A0ABP0MUG3_9DINO